MVNDGVLARRWAWLVAGVCGIAAVGLVAVTVLVDLDTGDRLASVTGSVVALVVAAVSVVVGVRQGGGAADAGTDAGGGVRAHGRGAVAAGGNVSGNAVGARSRVARRASAPPTSTPVAASQPQVTASGRGAVAAGGDVAGNAIGNGSEAEEQ